jgi:dTDP-4-dehydrorhamnose reductase
MTSGRPPRWLVTGAGGMLGLDLVAVVRDAGHEVTAATRRELDVTDPDAVRAAVAGHDVVINAAACTDVDGAEATPEVAEAVNGRAPGHVATACASAGARLLHVSTDYVLRGDARSPYPEDAPTGPLNAYGCSKLAGERAVVTALPDAAYVVRTAWLYGERGRSFVGTMLRLAAGGGSVSAVDDARGQPTWTVALARQLVALGEAALARRAPPGVYHGTAAGEATWYQLARAVFELAGFDPSRVRPASSAAFPQPARRPAYTVLAHGRWAEAGLEPMVHWRDALATALGRPGFRAGARVGR